MAAHRIVRVTGGQVAYTNTSRVADRQIVQALRYIGKEIDLDSTVYHFKRHRNAWRWGMAYNGIPSLANMDGLDLMCWRFLVVVSDHYGDNAKRVVMDRNIFHTIAHEAKHVDHYRHRLSGGEARADAFADWITGRAESDGFLARLNEEVA